MKKILIPLIFLFTVSVNAQNIQALTNFDKNIFTLEQYKPLKHGALYYFTDFKVYHNGFSEAYTEISGYRTIYKTFSATIQYNAGLNRSFTIYPIYLCGVSNSFTFRDKSNLNIDFLYRYQDVIYLVDDEYHHGYQITAVYHKNYPKVSISGYCDIWNNKYYIVEPQAFYKLLKNVWVGLEYRASNYDLVLNYDAEGNYIGSYANYLMIGVKINFE